MEYYAHKTKDGRTQTLISHLKQTAELAENNAVESVKKLAYAAGYAMQWKTG